MISVIMLTYNRETLVKKAIESILAQTFEDFEFIIVDNGSNDKSGKIADDYAKKDKRIKVTHKERGNIGSGRNAGLDVAKGDYIAFIDDDDWCEPDFLEFMYNLIIEYDADIAMCGANDKIFDERVLYTAEEALITLFWRRRFNVQFPTKLIKCELFNGIRFSVTAKYDDIDLMPKIMASTNKIAYHGIPKYTFYRHTSNNSLWTKYHNLLNFETLNEYLNVYRMRTVWLCERFPEKTELWNYFEWSFILSMVEKVSRYEITECRSLYDNMISTLRVNIDTFLDNEFLQDFEKVWIRKFITNS